MKVAVTGLNNVDNPGPGVPVIRALKESEKFDGEIIGLLYDSLEPGAYMENVSDNNYMIPYPSGGLEPLYERIKYIHEIENLDAIIPTLDSELYGFTKLASKLNELGIKTFLPSKELLNIRAKDKLANFCEGNGIRFPKTILATSTAELYSLPSHFNYPAVVKGIFYDAYIVNNFNEAQSAFNKIRYKWGLPIIVQEMITGEEYNVAALGDGTGNTIGAVGMKKLYITEKGKGWAGITVNDPVLIELSEKIIKILNWKSGAELEFVKDNKSNNYYLIEINPRFPAWVYLTVSAGQNLPGALLQLALGNKVKPFSGYEVGKIFIRYSWDLITNIKEFEELNIKGELKNGKSIV